FGWSFPRKRESRAISSVACPWPPAFAGVTTGEPKHDASLAFQRDGLSPGLAATRRYLPGHHPEPAVRPEGGRRPLPPLSRRMGAVRRARYQHHDQRAPRDGDLRRLGVHDPDGDPGARNEEGAAARA